MACAGVDICIFIWVRLFLGSHDWSDASNFFAIDECNLAFLIYIVQVPHPTPPHPHPTSQIWSETKRNIGTVWNFHYKHGIWRSNKKWVVLIIVCIGCFVIFPLFFPCIICQFYLMKCSWYLLEFLFKSRSDYFLCVA